MSRPTQSGIGLVASLLLCACAAVEPSGTADGGSDVGAEVSLDAPVEEEPPEDVGGGDAALEVAEPFCGDGQIDDGEQCDDGNRTDDDRCSNACTLNPASVCQPCIEDGDCGRPTDLCLDLADGRFCGRDCQPDEEMACAEGFECREVRDGDTVLGLQCAPRSDHCGDCPDADGDEVCDTLDVCPQHDDRRDADADGTPDGCDVCAAGDDALDADQDGVPDGCDLCGTGDDGVDTDSDGVPNACDICNGGNDALDDDADGIPDYCDACSGADDRLDADGDATPDACDQCAGGDDHLDADNDGVADYCDCDASSTVCDLNADCFDDASGVVCLCQQGFKGDGQTCQDIDECDLGTAGCHAQADCVNRTGGFDCVCRDGWQGTGFECSDVDECDDELDECDPHASCENLVGSYSCSCDAGYEGTGLVCANVDECDLELDACDALAECTDLEGSYQCDCIDGYTGTGFECSDLDECDAGVDACHPQATCINRVGSYDCECNGGWTGDGFSCADVNECSLGLDRCHRNAQCGNTQGSYLCTCNAGLLGNGFSCFWSTPVLAFHDGGDTPVEAAATALSLPLFEVATTQADFQSAFDDGGFGLVVYDSPSGSLSAATRQRLTTWVRSGGDLVFSYWNLDADAELRATLGIGSTGDFFVWRDVYADPGSPVDLFERFTTLPSPLVGTDDQWSDNGDTLTLGGSGFLAGRFDSAAGPGSIAITQGDRVIVNGFLFYDARGTNADGDGIFDHQELMMNEMAYVLEDGGCFFMEGFEEGVWPVAPWLAGEASPSPVGQVDAASAHDGGFGLTETDWYYENQVTLGQPGDRLVAWVRNDSDGNGRAYLGVGASASGARSFVVGPNTTTHRLLFQDNDGWGFEEVAEVAQTFTTDTWYRVELEYLTASLLRGRLYDAAGTLLRSLTHDFGTGQSGGVAVRTFGGLGIDSLMVCRVR